MSLMIKKRVKRKINEDKETEFSINGRQVPEEKFERFQKRFKTPAIASPPGQMSPPACKHI